MKTLRLHYITTYTANNVNQYIVQNALVLYASSGQMSYGGCYVYVLKYATTKKTNKFKAGALPKLLIQKNSVISYKHPYD